MQFDLTEEKVPKGAAEALIKLLEDEPGYDFFVDVAHGKDKDNQIILQVAIVFKTYKEYARYFDFYNTDRRDVDHYIINTTIEEKAFYRERTQTFENPWKTALDNAPWKVAELVSHIEAGYRGYIKSAEPEYLYLFMSSFRRSEVTGTVSTSRAIDAYDYLFIYGADERSVDQIKIFDRFANSPLWYVIAVAATIIFMIAAYFVFAKMKKMRYNGTCHLQSSPTSTET